MEQAAPGTLFGPFGFPRFERSSAAATESMSPIPLYDLHGPAGQPEQVLIQAAVYFAQTFKGHPFGRQRLFGKVHCIGGVSIELAQEVLGYKRYSQLGKIHYIGNPG
jgi:hypothetical protein